MSGLLDRLTSLPVGCVYLIVGLLAFAEDALFIGFLLPGETAAILGGVTASLGRTSLTAMIVIVVVAAVLAPALRKYATRGKRKKRRPFVIPARKDERAIEAATAHTDRSEC